VAERHYHYLTERGLVEADLRAGDVPTIPGHVLLAMAAGNFSANETLAHAKNLMRQLIQYHLGGQALESRRILMELQEL
jgi:DNA repair protein RecO (recombination protein O)